MAHTAFSIPSDKRDLIGIRGNNYTVENIVIPSEIVQKLEEARTYLREEGANYIIDNFDTYYSVLHHADNLKLDVVYKAYYDLFKAVTALENSIAFLLDDKDSLDEEIKSKYVTVMKMLMYIFIQFITYLENKKQKNQDDLLVKNRNKQKKDGDFTVNKSKVLNKILTLLQREINLFWDPPIVEQELIDILAELCFSFLQNPSVKQEKEVISEIFGVFGNLIKTYDFGKTFVTRLIQSIRMYEHVVHCSINGIKLIVEQFNCRNLIHYFVKEATEWQTDETFQDAQGTRCCSIFLTELASLMPDLMLPEIMYLNQYLSHESQPLRTSILNVITEVILNVLTKPDLSEEEKESRDEFFEILLEHTCDISAVVRSKVIQNFARLQKENAIPLNYQNNVLAKVIEHLYDKGAVVRKSAINCVTTFIQHNPYSANLQLKQNQETLASKIEHLHKLEASYEEAKNAKIEQLKAEWNEIAKDLRVVIQRKLEEDESEDDDEEENNEPENIDKNKIIQAIRSNLEDKKYDVVFKLCVKLKGTIEEWKERKSESVQEEINLYLRIISSFYINEEKVKLELRTGAGMTDEDIKKIESLENLIKYLNNTVSFLKVIDASIKPMKTLLFTQTISDMHEAINFFVTAYQFKIDNAASGVSEMLKLMQYNEQERKDGVIEAFKTIYLTTDTKNMVEHSTTVVNRLIDLLNEITFDNLDDFENIISEWTSKGIIDNSIIDRCWQFYTKREQVSDETALNACDLLRMAAKGRRTIITKNIPLVTTLAFDEKQSTNMRFLEQSCRLLAVAGMEKIDIQSEKAPFKISYQDKIFDTLANILIENFFLEVPYYCSALEASMEFIFRVCSKPLEIGEKIIKKVASKMEKKMTILHSIRFCKLLGCLALNMLEYFDNTVYRELKRRNYLREARKENKKHKNSRNKSRMSLNKSGFSVTPNESTMNDSVLMGADAEDTDAEFILNTLENYVLSPTSLLGQYVPYLTNLIRRPDLYNNFLLQQFAVIAFMRFMLLSSKFCNENIRLLFTVFEKTTFNQLKCTILIYLADLLTRFPNVVEPWSSRIYAKLKDPEVKVRKTALYSLSNLILRDMIRAHSHISEIAACLIDENQTTKNMCETFFRKLAQKDQNLVNVMPDIFSHLVKIDEISEESLRYIMKFLFDLVDSSKRVENLVDRFCHKYVVDDDKKLNRNITYCLSLINYNDKTLKKLHELFPCYKNHLHDQEIYSTFNQILAECSKSKVGKTDLKPIVTDIEACIASVFEINEDGQPSRPPPLATKSAKKPRGRQNKKRPSRKSSSDESGSETVKNRKQKKTSKRRRGRSSSSTDSD